jgi:hypothetical protein
VSASTVIGSLVIKFLTFMFVLPLHAFHFDIPTYTHIPIFINHT